MGCCGGNEKLGIAGIIRREAINWAVNQPALYNHVQRWRRAEDRGLGDTLRHIFADVGAARFAELLRRWNIDCRCEDEQQFWNERRPYDSP